jgi:hypothetical protein
MTYDHDGFDTLNVRDISSPSIFLISRIEYSPPKHVTSLQVMNGRGDFVTIAGFGTVMPHGFPAFYQVY